MSIYACAPSFQITASSEYIRAHWRSRADRMNMCYRHVLIRLTSLRHHRGWGVSSCPVCKVGCLSSPESWRIHEELLAFSSTGRRKKLGSNVNTEWRQLQQSRCLRQQGGDKQAALPWLPTSSFLGCLWKGLPTLTESLPLWLILPGSTLTGPPYMTCHCTFLTCVHACTHT